MARRIGIFGVDIGTESLRTVLIDLQGTVLAMAAHPYSTASPARGRFEQDPADWWTGLRETVRSCLVQADFAAENIVAMGFTGTACTPVPVDNNGDALRPAILWMDTRAHAEAQEITALHHPAVMRTGGIVSAEWMLPKALWLKRHEPRAWERTAKFMECFDYLIYRLSNRYVTATGAAAGKRHWSRANGGWPTDFFNMAGVPELVDKNASEVVFPFEVAATLSEKGARELGLRAGIVLTNCGPDGYAAMAGMNALSPRCFGLIIGSSTVHLLPTESPAHIPGMWGPWCDILVPEKWLIEGGQLATGSILRWFVGHFAAEARIKAQQQAMNVYEWLDNQAAAIPPGSDGLILLDYWKGNRTPHNDALASGAIWGFTLHHTQAHVYRAILEGTACGVAHTLIAFRASGLAPDFLIASGGGSKSRLWLQIHADACGLPVRVPRYSCAPAVGSAVNAAVAAGFFGDVTEAAGQMIKLGQTIDPIPETHRLYQEYLQHYVGTYQALHERMQAIALACDRSRQRISERPASDSVAGGASG